MFRSTLAWSLLGMVAAVAVDTSDAEARCCRPHRNRCCRTSHVGYSTYNAYPSYQSNACCQNSWSGNATAFTPVTTNSCCSTGFNSTSSFVTSSPQANSGYVTPTSYEAPKTSAVPSTAPAPPTEPAPKPAN